MPNKIQGADPEFGKKGGSMEIWFAARRNYKLNVVIEAQEIPTHKAPCGLVPLCLTISNRQTIFV